MQSFMSSLRAFRQAESRVSGASLGFHGGSSWDPQGLGGSLGRSWEVVGGPRGPPGRPWESLGVSGGVPGRPRGNLGECLGGTEST